MFVEQFTAWAASASVEERCNAVTTIAQAMFDTSIDEVDRDDCEQVLSLSTTDPDDRVRIALARALTVAPGAPPALLWSLCDDTPAIAAQVYARSSHFRQADLVDTVEESALVQCAVAGRGDIGPQVVRAIVERGCADAIRTLLSNAAVAIGPGLKDMIAKRFASEASIRALLLDYQDIDPTTRLDLRLAQLEDLQAMAGAFAADSKRLDTTMADALDRTIIDVARCAGPQNMDGYVRHLQAAQCLTPALLVRSTCEDNAALFETAIAVLSGVPVSRVQAIVDSGRTVAFQALFLRTGLPAHVLPTLLAAVDVWGRGESCDAALLLEHSQDADSATLRMLSRIDQEQRRERWEPAERQLAIAA